MVGPIPRALGHDQGGCMGRHLTIGGYYETRLLELVAMRPVVVDLLAAMLRI